MNSKRPVNLNLMKIRMPLTAYVSILHRLSGVILCFTLPCVIWALDASLQSAESFAALQLCFHGWIVRLCVGGLIAAFCYHFLAGMRHLLMDIHIGETLRSARIGVWVVMLGMSVVLVLLGCWIGR